MAKAPLGSSASTTAHNRAFMIFRSPTAIVRSSIIASSTTRAVAVERFGPHVCRGTAGSLSDAEIREDAAYKVFADRKSVVSGKRVSVGVDIGGRRSIKKKKK